jgi:Rrf2 family protein
MKVSKKAYYGLRAAVSLAASGQAVSAHDLAEAEYIPEDFLEKILQKLRQVGIVESKKGVDGGYALARPAGTVSVWDILEELDGPIRSFAPPLKNTLPCSIVSHCQTNEVWRTLEKEIEKTLSKITLDNLAVKSTTFKTQNAKQNTNNKIQKHKP